MKNYMLEANSTYEVGEFQKALLLYAEEINANPNNITAYERSARCLWSLKKPTDAIMLCKKILELKPDHVMAHAILAISYHAVGKRSESEEEIKIAREMAPQNVEVLSFYGTLLLLDKKMSEARDILETVIRSDPDNYVAYNNLTVLYALEPDRKRILFCVQEMYRLRRTNKNFIRLLVAYVDYYRISNILLVTLGFLTCGAMIYKVWILLFVCVAVVIALLLLRRYLRE